ncbi:unnamed protein product, partial [Closterium sp. NIES-54]
MHACCMISPVSITLVPLPTPRLTHHIPLPSLHASGWRCWRLGSQDWTAKLSDFGMCKEQEAGKSHVSTRVMGTLGYLDPDYMETGLLRQSSDVYAFGVFLLELITGKRAVSDTGQPLTSWVFPLLDQKKPEIDLLIDSALESSFDRDSALKIA